MATDPPPTRHPPAADHLYDLPASEFVAARDELVRSLRADGQPDLASEVSSLRRPALVAAELNLALRADRDGLDRLLDAAAALRQGHHDLVAGKPVDLAALQSAHRAAARSVASHASRDHETLAATLERASLDEAQHPGLRSAAYTALPEVAIGFDVVGPLPAPPSTPDRHLSAAPDPPARASPDPAEPVTAEPAAARDRARKGSADAHALTLYEEAVRAEALAQRRVAAAAETADRAAQRVAELDERLAEARSHQTTSAQKLDQARAAAERAAADLAAAAAALEQVSDPRE